MRFQPPSKSLSARDYQLITFGALLTLTLAIAMVIANLRVNSGGGDFFVLWVAARGYLFDKVEPYSGDVAAAAQRLAYGGPSAIGEKPLILTTPFHLVQLSLPLAVIHDAALARAIYRLFTELALAALIVLSLRLTESQVPRGLLLIFVLACVFNFYSFEAFLTASPALINGMIYIAILHLLERDSDELLGALIAVSLFDWPLGGPFMLLVLWRLYRENRTRVLAGFAMLTFLLLAISFLLYPGWIIAYLRAIANDLRLDYGFSLRTALQASFPVSGAFLARVTSIALIGLLGFEWSRTLNDDPRRFYWVACVTLAATPLLGWRTEASNLAVLIIPLALVMTVVYDRWQLIGAVLTAAALLIFIALPWLLSLPDKYRLWIAAPQSVFLFAPALALIGLYWIRWWTLRPPRTWVDRANAR